MIKCVIIDDEPLARSIIKEYLADYATIEVVHECKDGFEGVKAIMNYGPDLIFLDVQMPKINGFEMLELLENPPSVIFTTAFDEYAIKAFEANAIDYLLKPFSKERFDNALQKWKLQKGVANQKPITENILKHTEEQHRIVVKAGNDIKIIPMKDILYLEAYDDYVKIHTGEGYFLKKKTMSYYEQTLDTKAFVRVHRSFIVSVPQLTKIEPMEKDGHVAVLKSGLKVPISRTGFQKIKEVLGI